MLDIFFETTGIKGGSFPCVYQLIHNDEVVYVGSTLNLRERIARHYSEGEKLFSSVLYRQCRADEMLNNEAKMIVEINPKLNKTLPSNDHYISKAASFTILKKAVNEFLETLSPVYIDKSKKSHSGQYVSLKCIEKVSDFIKDGE